MNLVSPDLYLLNKDGLYEWSPSRSTQAWDRAYVEFRAALSQAQSASLLIGIPGAGKTTFLEGNLLGKSTVVFDATLTSRMSRRPLVEMAKAAGVRIEAIVFEVPLIVAFDRNAARGPERRVPAETFFRMARQLEEEPPTLREGFWRITAAP
jgi:predicted kinase